MGIGTSQPNNKTLFMHPKNSFGDFGPVMNNFYFYRLQNAYLKCSENFETPFPILLMIFKNY